MKLWQGWHNTGQDRPYFHYGLLGSTEKQNNVSEFFVRENVVSDE